MNDKTSIPDPASPQPRRNRTGAHYRESQSETETTPENRHGCFRSWQLDNCHGRLRPQSYELYQNRFQAAYVQLTGFFPRRGPPLVFFSVVVRPVRCADRATDLMD